MAITASTISTTQTLEEFRLEFNKLQSDVSTLESNPTYGTSLIFEGATADAYETTLTVTDPTADRTITLPNATGTVLLSTQATFEPTGDTSADDNAAIGYTAAEGLILTGQGSTSDITLKNDADGTVFTVPTGTDDILFPDNAKAMFGAGSDLQLYHDASHSYIVDNGTGNLKIQGTQVDILGSGETMATFVDDGAVTLYYDNTAKLATSSAGGTLTGTWETTTALVPDASDGAALGTTSLEWSDLYLADGAVIGFGDNQDVTLTHVHDTGLLLNGAMQLQFSDASQYINAPSATVLDINATDEIELNATLVDINANVEISGTATTTGVHTFTAVPVLPANSIDSDHYVDGSIDNAHIADNAIDSEHYTDGSIDNAHIADDAIDSEHYAADSIDEEHIANDAVGSAELKTLSTLLIKDSSGSTLKTLYGAGA